MSELALKLIIENKKTRATFLDLGNCDLKAIPEELGELVWLEELSFSSDWYEFNEGDWESQSSQNTGSANQLLSLFSNQTQSNPFSTLIKLKKLCLDGNSKISDLTPLASLSALQQLNIFDTQVNDLTPLASLSALKYLDVPGVQVSDLTPLISLSVLQALNLYNTKVRDLTPLASLLALKWLRVSSTVVSDITPLASLYSLQYLDINSIEVSDLTPLASLSGLQQLDVSRTKVSDLTPLANLSALQQLDISRTKVSDLTPLSSLSALQQLDVSRTKISDLTPLSSLSALQKLYVSSTKVSNLSPILSLIASGGDVKWSNQSWEGNGIYVEGCPLTNPPTEVVKQGNAAILNYFQEQKAQGVDKLYEAKMLIIGEGGAGKTSLLRRLYQSDQPLPDENESTKGIEIIRHEFTLDNGRTFRLNVWDFGGQEIYHATHQFFLTKRSLYVLLDDTRKDYKSVHDAGFKYWLEVVDLLGDHSPVLIFQNEKSGRSKTIDESGIKGKFDNVKEFYRGNLEQQDAANDLRQSIELFAQQLPHIGEELPAKWVSIRADIEALAKDNAYISQQEYFDIYHKHLEFDREKALFLSEYLHDLGAFLHFQDDLLLARIVVLQNQWATTAVFKILDDEIVKANKGLFNADDCYRLWQDSDYAEMHLELLALMQKFELCYQLPDKSSESWLAPQLLSPSRPESMKEWAKPGDLVLRYDYDFLPKGMISRLIVRMHRFVFSPDLSWSTGVLFERNETQLLVDLSEQGNGIVLRARGLERKELLSVISADLDALNASYHSLPEMIKKQVPCICSRCHTLTEPEFFEQKRLLQRKKDNKSQIECPSSYEYVSVLELLDGIKVEELPDWATNEQKPITNPHTQTIKIFLASSAELKDDRDAFDLYFRQQNDHYRNQGLYLEIIRWETFLDAMSETRLQDEYNKALQDCDIFVSLFFTKTGKFTEEEFDTAHQKFKNTGKPKIFTFFKDSEIKTGKANKKDMNSLWSFQEKLDGLGHFYTQYNNVEDLKLQFKDQLVKLKYLKS